MSVACLGVVANQTDTSAGGTITVPFDVDVPRSTPAEAVHLIVRCEFHQVAGASDVVMDVTDDASHDPFYGPCYDYSNVYSNFGVNFGAGGSASPGVRTGQLLICLVLHPITTDNSLVVDVTAVGGAIDWYRIVAIAFTGADADGITKFGGPGPDPLYNKFKAVTNPQDGGDPALPWPDPGGGGQNADLQIGGINGPTWLNHADVLSDVRCHSSTHWLLRHSPSDTEDDLILPAACEMLVVFHEAHGKDDNWWHFNNPSAPVAYDGYDGPVSAISAWTSAGSPDLVYEYYAEGPAWQCQVVETFPISGPVTNPEVGGCWDTLPALSAHAAIGLNAGAGPPRCPGAFGKLKFVQRIPGAPDDDFFDTAALIEGSSGTYGPEEIGIKTIEDGEPTGENVGSIHQTVWLKWVAPADGTVTFDTHGSLATDGNGGSDIPPTGPPFDGPSLDTTLAGWTGTFFGDLVEQDSNDDDPSGDWGYNSLISFVVTEGTTYYIQIGTYDEPYTGSLVVNWSLV